MRALAPVVAGALLLAACSTSRLAESNSPAASPAPCNSPAPKAPPRGESQTIDYSLDVPAGQAVQKTVAVEPNELLFGVLVRGALRFTVTSPSGKVYDRSTTDPSANHHYSTASESFAFDNPQAGTWTLTFGGGPEATSNVQLDVTITLFPASVFAPIVIVTASPDTGPAPLTVTFRGLADGEHGATVVSTRFDFGDCTPASAVLTPTHVYRNAGTYTATLVATDSKGQSSSDTHQIVVS